MGFSWLGGGRFFRGILLPTCAGLELATTSPEGKATVIEDKPASFSAFE